MQWVFSRDKNEADSQDVAEWKCNSAGLERLSHNPAFSQDGIPITAWQQRPSLFYYLTWKTLRWQATPSPPTLINIWDQ